MIQASRLAYAGQHEAALELFREAYALAPEPGFLYDVAVEYEALGHAGEAFDTYEQFLRDPRDTPREFIAVANDELRALRNRVGQIEIRSEASEAQIFIDEQPRGTTAEHRPIHVDPGAHRVLVQAPGFAPFRTEIQVAPGAKAIVQATLEPGTSAEASDLPASGKGASREPARDEATGEPTRRTYFDFSVGAGFWAGGVRNGPSPSPTFAAGSGYTISLSNSVDIKLGGKVAFTYLSEPKATDTFLSLLVDPSLSIAILDGRLRPFVELGIGLLVLSGVPDDSLLLEPAGGRVTGALAGFELRPAMGLTFALTGSFSVFVAPSLAWNPAPSAHFTSAAIVRVETAAGIMGKL